MLFIWKKMAYRNFRLVSKCFFLQLRFWWQTNKSSNMVLENRNFSTTHAPVFFKLHLIVYLCIHYFCSRGRVVGALCVTGVWRSEDNLQRKALWFHGAGPRNLARIVSLSSTWHLTRPAHVFLAAWSPLLRAGILDTELEWPKHHRLPFFWLWRLGGQEQNFGCMVSNEGSHLVL